LSRRVLTGTVIVSELVQGADDSTQVGVQHVARSAGTSRLSRRVAAHG
jgi:hypothetical protein